MRSRTFYSQQMKEEENFDSSAKSNAEMNCNDLQTAVMSMNWSISSRDQEHTKLEYEYK